MSGHIELFQELLQSKQETCAEGHLLNGRSMTLGALVAVSRDKAKLMSSDSEEVLEKLVEAINHLNNKLKNGESIYGVNTGYGGSADTVTDKVDHLQTSLMNLLSVGFRGPLSYEAIRGTVCLRANSAIRGHSGIRLSIIQDLCQLLNQDVIPLLPKRGSISASGDLIPLAYLAAFLEGKDYAKGSCKKVSAEKKNEREIVTAMEALKKAGVAPQVLQPKEVLAIVNGTSASTAVAGLALADTHMLLMLSQLTTALDVEAMLGTKESFHTFIHECRPHKGQIEIAKNISYLLDNSKLCHDYEKLKAGEKPKLRQDRYSIRTTPQWLGPQLETLQAAHKTIEIELNSTTDNPILDPSTGKFYHGGNFQATAIAVAMENVRVAIQHIGKLVYAQHLEIVNKDMNKGLSANLAFSLPSLDYGMKGVEISMAAYMAELSYVCNTVTNHVHSTDLHNQNVNSIALIAARATTRAVKICQMMFAAHIYGLLQAIDLRARDVLFFNKLSQSLSVWLQDALAVSLNESDLAKESTQKLKEKLIEIACHLCQENQNMDPEHRFMRAFNILFSELFDSLSKLGCPPISLDKLQACKEKMIGMTIKLFDETNEICLQIPMAESLLGNTYPIYHFFRETKGLKLNKGTTKDASHGETIGKIFETIQSWEVVPPMMKCFRGLQDEKAQLYSNSRLSMPKL